MHSLETGIVVSIAAFFFLSFLTFTFLREVNISNEINEKYKVEREEYQNGRLKKYNPEVINNVLNIIFEEDDNYVREDE